MEKENSDMNREEGEGRQSKLIKLKDLGLSSLSNISYHIGIENLYDSNLINDIGGISYTKNSRGKMTPAHLEGRWCYFDDIYFCTYYYEDEYKRGSDGKVNLLGKGDFKDPNTIPPTTKYINIIKIAIESILNVSIANRLKIIASPEFKVKTKSKIIPIFGKLNAQTGGEFLKNSQDLKNTEKKPVGVVGIKVDVSNIPFQLLISNLKLIKEKLRQQGFANYQCDITYDFGGTLNRDELYKFLLSTGLFIEEEEEEEKQKGNFRILQNRRELEKTAGYNILRYRYEKGGVDLSIKYYNKIVSNFEAGNTQDHYGAHLAEYAYNHQDQHLKELFKHPKVEECGVTRLELSFCTSNLETDCVKLLQEEYDIVKYAPVFHIQPRKEQFSILANNITKSCVIANRTTKELLTVFHGTSNTRRFCGVNYPQLKQKENETDEEFLKRWEHAKMEVMSDFGFHDLQINLIEYEIKIKDGEKYLFFLPPQCYMREGETFLSPTKQPTLDYERFEDLPDMNEYCPHTEHVKFRFRIGNGSGEAGKRTILNKPFKVDRSFNISLLSTRKRKEKLDEEEYRLRRLEYWESQGQKDLKRKTLEEERKRKIKEEMEENAKLLNKYRKEKERWDTIKEVFNKFTNQKEEEEKLLNEEYFRVFAFKIYKQKKI